MIKFIYRVQNLLAERGEVLNDLSRGVGVSRRTIYRGIKSKSMIAAIAYYFRINAEELVAGTELEEIWEEDTSEY
jgi:hypothetical protein